MGELKKILKEFKEKYNLRVYVCLKNSEHLIVELEIEELLELLETALKFEVFKNKIIYSLFFSFLLTPEQFNKIQEVIVEKNINLRKNDFKNEVYIEFYDFKIINDILKKLSKVLGGE